MTRQPHIASYYSASAHPAAERPVLNETIECDVCVIGGGISGCSAALHLAERGYRVVMLESQRIGWGASGRSGAQAIVGVAAGQHKLEKLIGATDARAVWDLSVEALGLMRSLIERYHIDCDWVDGQMLVAIKPRHDRELRAEVRELHESFGYQSVRYLPRDEVRSVVASERYVSGMYDANGGHLHPLNYTLGLAAAAESLGVKIFEGSRALSYNPRGTGRGANASHGVGHADLVQVRTEHGEVRARHLVLCGNAYLTQFARALESKIMAVGTYIVATEKLGAERAKKLITNNACVSDINWVLDYFRLSADHRLLFGGRVSYSGLDPFRTASVTRSRMVKVFPQLKDVKLEYSWGGYVDITLNRAPHFGRLEPNVYFLQGFSGHGIALTGLAGKLVAEAIAGTAERFDVFARIPHSNFPGGAALRRPALVLAMLYYRIKDLLP